MTAVVIPATVEQINPAFFQLFPNAARISVDAENPNYQSYNGMLFNKELTDLLLVPEGMEGAAVLPESIVAVPACVFSRCIKLSAIDVPTGSAASARFASENGVLYTADKIMLLAAPAGLGASVSIAAECVVIAEGAFWGNAALETIIVNGNVEQIAVNMGADETVPAFNERTTAHAMVALAGDFSRAAWEATGFVNFSEPAQPGEEIVPVEGSGFAFTLLDDYTLAVRWQGDDAAPAALQIPEYGMLDGVQYAVSRIAEGGFAGQTSIVTVEVPSTVLHVDDRAFENCSALQTATLANSVQTIGARAFANTALLSMVLPMGLETLNAGAFGGLNGTIIVALSEIPLMSTMAFDGSHGLEVYIPYHEDESVLPNIGLPASSNHVFLYGVEINNETIQLTEGQVVNLFDGGYLETSGDVQVNYSYKARPISIDTQTGDIEAKAVGNSEVKISLSIDVPTVYVNGIRSKEVRLERASLVSNRNGFQNDIEIFSDFLTIDLASASTMYSVNAISDSKIATYANTVTQNGLVFTDINANSCSVKAENTSLSGDVVIPSKVGDRFVTTISPYAFKGTQIKSLYIPATVTTISTQNFVDLCSKIESFEVAGANTSYASYEGALYSKDDNGNILALCRYPSGSTTEHVVIKQGTQIIANSAITDNASIKTISIPDSVHTTEGWLLTNIPNLESVTIPDSVKTVDGLMCAPYESNIQFDKLTKAVLGKGLTSLDTSSFSAASKLKDIYVRGTVTKIGSNTFKAVNKDTCIVHLPEGTPDSAVAIWDTRGKGFKNVVVGNPDLEYYWINKTQKTIGVGKKNDSLSGDVNIPAKYTLDDIEGNVTTIGFNAFNQTSITSLFIPSSVTSISTQNFVDECPELERIDVEENNETYMSIDGALYSKNAMGQPEKLFRYPGNAKSTLVQIFEGTKSIENSAITDNQYIQEIEIPSSVISISEWFMTNIPNLKSLTIPDSVTSCNGLICAPFGYDAWQAKAPITKFNKLTSVTLGAGVTSLKTGSRCSAFATASALQHIYVRSPLLAAAALPADSFKETNKQTCIVHLPEGTPDSAVAIWDTRGKGFQNVVVGNPDLEYSWVNKTQKTISVKKKNDSLSGDVYIPSTYMLDGELGTVTTIKDNAFLGTAITSLYIPSTVNSIVTRNFVDDCLNLERIDVEAGNSTYVSYDGALYLKKNGEIHTLARYPSAAKTSHLVIKEGTQVIDNSAIANNTYITSVSLPSTVTTIDSWYLTNTPNLETLVIPDHVTSVSSILCAPYTEKRWSEEKDPITFYTKLTSVTFGSGVKSLGVSFGCPAFGSASALQDIYVKGQISNINLNCFKETNKDTCIVHLPAGTPDNIVALWDTRGLGFKNVKTDSFGVTFDAQEGAFLVGDRYEKIISDVSFTPGLPISRPAYKEERAGYEIDYWYTKSGSTETKWNFTTSPAYEAVTLYAKWKPITYTVILNSPERSPFVDAGGKSVSTQWKVAFESSTGVYGTSFNLPVVKFRGYTFANWNTTYGSGSYGGRSYASGASFDIKQYIPGYGNGSFVDGYDAYVSSSNTITLYAKWTEKTYTVHYRTSTSATSDIPSTTTTTAKYTDSFKLPNQYYTAINGQYYTQWGTKDSGTQADGNYTANTGATVNMKTVIDGSSSVNYVTVPSNSNIYDITDVYFYPQWQYITYTLSYSTNVASDGNGKPTKATLPSSKASITYRSDGIYLNGKKQASGIALGEPSSFGEGYSFAGWAKSATSSALSNTLTFSNFTDFFTLTFNSSNTSTSRTQSVVPLWNEFTYNVTLYNTDATGKAISESSQVGSAVKYHTSVSLAIPSAFTIPNGKKGSVWQIDSVGGSQTTGINTGSATTAIADIVAKTASANKGSATSTANLKLYIKYINRDDLKYTVYYVYEKDGNYPDNPKDTSSAEVASTDYSPVTNEASIALNTNDKKPSRTGYEFDSNMSDWKNNPSNGGFNTVQGNDSVLFAYFKRQYTVEFKVGAGGASTVQNGTVSNTYTYTHNNGANKGTATKMSAAIADRNKVTDFESPAAGNYFDNYVFSNAYKNSTSQNDNTNTFTLTSTDDINADASYTAVFKAIDYRIKYRHAYDASIGMTGNPDQTVTLDTKHFVYSDLGSGSLTITNTDNDSKFVVPIGYKQTGWKNTTGASATYDVDARVALTGSAGNTFASLGFDAKPNTGHKEWQETVVDAMWDARTYTIKFWKYTDKAKTSEIEVKDGSYGAVKFTDTVALPDQNSQSETKPHPYIDDTMFGYSLTSWSMAATPTGELPESTESLLVAGNSYTARQMIFGRTGNLAETVVKEPDGGVINLYATWTPSYNVTVPTTSKCINFNIDVVDNSIREQSVPITVQSLTPRPISVDAYAEVVSAAGNDQGWESIDPSDESGWKNSSAAELFIENPTSMNAAQIQNELSKIRLNVSGENGVKDASLTICGNSDQAEPIVEKLAAATSATDEQAQAHINLSLALNGVWVNKSLGGSVTKEWGPIARLVWVISGLRDNKQYLYANEGEAYTSSTE